MSIPPPKSKASFFLPKSCLKSREKKLEDAGAKVELK